VSPESSAEDIHLPKIRPQKPLPELDSSLGVSGRLRDLAGERLESRGK
jgi:hypothetical protein